MKLNMRFTLIMFLPIFYMGLIWIQSSHFDPESLSGMLTQVSFQMILLAGVILELAHFFEFGILYMLIIIVFLCFGRLTWWKEIVAGLLAFSYGLADEIHQMYVPYRSASLGDLIKNTVGILVVWWIVHSHYFDKKHTRFSQAMQKVTESFHKDKSEM